jgi:hypothetical protein
MANHLVNIPRSCAIALFNESLVQGLQDLGILTSLKGINVGFLTTSSYVDPVGFFCSKKTFLPRQKSPR